MESLLEKDLAAFAGIKGLVTLVRMTHPTLATARLKVAFGEGWVVFTPDATWLDPVKVPVADGMSAEAEVAMFCAAAVRRRAQEANNAAAQARLQAERAAENAEHLASEARRFDAFAAHVAMRDATPKSDAKDGAP